MEFSNSPIRNVRDVAAVETSNLHWRRFAPLARGWEDDDAADDRRPSSRRWHIVDGR
jgi:hypothetical protein